jgi:methyl-accepting chemotaxis protein
MDQVTQQNAAMVEQATAAAANLKSESLRPGGAGLALRDR